MPCLFCEKRVGLNPNGISVVNNPHANLSRAQANGRLEGLVIEKREGLDARIGTFEAGIGVVNRPHAHLLRRR